MELEKGRIAPRPKAGIGCMDRDTPAVGDLLAEPLGTPEPVERSNPERLRLPETVIREEVPECS